MKNSSSIKTLQSAVSSRQFQEPKKGELQGVNVVISEIDSCVAIVGFRAYTNSGRNQDPITILEEKGSVIGDENKLSKLREA